MRYIRVEFTFGIECLAWQEVDESGVVTRYLDDAGDEIVVPDVTESKVVSEDEKPAWA